MKSLIILVSSFVFSFGIFYGLGEMSLQVQMSEVKAKTGLQGVGKITLENAPLNERFRIPFSSSDRFPRDYPKARDAIIALRDSFRQAYLVAGSAAARIDINRKAEIEIARAIHDRLIPFWYGTSWDFNGTTEVPGEGKIACGYFVTTVLRDAGIPIARVKMAQAASSDMISEVCRRDPVWLSSRSPAELADWIRSQPGAVFLLGLDNHTGFLVREKESVWFIHASYAEPAVVLKERAESSEVLAASRVFVVGTLVPNEKLTQKWLGGI